MTEREHEVPTEAELRSLLGRLQAVDRHLEQCKKEATDQHELEKRVLWLERQGLLDPSQSALLNRLLSEMSEHLSQAQHARYEEIARRFDGTH